MFDFNEWQRQMEAEAALHKNSDGPPQAPVLSPIDLEVKTLCASFSEADLLASDSVDERVPENAVNSTASFKRQIACTESVQEAYEQLIGIADELSEELAEHRWEESMKYVDEHVAALRTAYESGQLEGLAASVCKNLSRMKAGLETFASYAVKGPSATADVGELFLLTALSAHELRSRLSQAYDC